MIERGQPGVVEAGADAAPQPGRKRIAVARVAIAVAGRRLCHLPEQRVELQPRRGDAVGGVALDERRRGEHQRPLDLRRRHAVEDRAERFADQRVDRDVGHEIADPRGDRRHQPRRVEQDRGAVAGADGEAAEPGALDRRGPLRLAFALAVGAVEDVGLGDLVEALAHELLLDEILDVLDRRRRLAEAGVGLGDDAVDDGVDAGRLDGRARRADRLRHRALDPAAVEGHDVAGAFDDAQNGHGRSPGWTWISQHMGINHGRSTTSCGRLRSGGCTTPEWSANHSGVVAIQ